MLKGHLSVLREVWGSTRGPENTRGSSGPQAVVRKETSAGLTYLAVNNL